MYEVLCHCREAISDPVTASSKEPSPEVSTAEPSPPDLSSEVTQEMKHSPSKEQAQKVQHLEDRLTEADKQKQQLESQLTEVENQKEQAETKLSEADKKKLEFQKVRAFLFRAAPKIQISCSLSLSLLLDNRRIIQIRSS